MPIKIFLAFLCLFVPGSGLLLNKHSKAAFLIPLIGIAWVCLISWTRFVITPKGFMTMLIGLVTLHLGSLIIGIILSKKNEQTVISIKHFLLLYLCLGLVSGAIAVSSHINKAEWFGFAFYHIPSPSMAPTLLPGDVVFVDTWVYRNSSIKNKDIVITKKSKQSIVMAKRVTNIRNIDGNDEIFLEGDNSKRSTDSRSFGWVNQNFVVGKVNFIWFSFKKKNRFLK